MQQIEIKILGAETSEARRASTRDAIARDLIALHLGDQEYAVALIGNHVTDELLGATVAVISRRVDQCHAERNARAQRLFFNSLRMSSLTEMPAALAERRDAGAVWKRYGPPRSLRCCARGKN